MERYFPLELSLNSLLKTLQACKGDYYSIEIAFNYNGLCSIEYQGAFGRIIILQQ